MVFSRKRAMPAAFGKMSKWRARMFATLVLAAAFVHRARPGVMDFSRKPAT